MKRCRRCNCHQLEIVRESVTQRGIHQYAMCWYRCPRCHEVSLSYRLLGDLPEPAAPYGRARDSDRSPEAAPHSDTDPVLSR